jgi:hypothetical protein
MTYFDDDATQQHDDEQQFVESDTDIQPDSQSTEAQASTPPVSLASLTVAEVLSQLFKQPRETWRGIYAVITNQDSDSSYTKLLPASYSQHNNTVITSDHDDDSNTSPLTTQFATLDQAQNMRNWLGDLRIVQLGMYISAFLVTWWGTSIMISGDARSRSLDDEFARAVPFVLIGVLLWLIADVIFHHQDLRNWWRKQVSTQRWFSLWRGIHLGLMTIGILILLDSTDEAPENVLSIVAPGIQILLLGIGLWIATDLGQSYWQWRLSRQRKDETDDIDAISNQQNHNEHLAWYMRIHPIRVFGVLVATFASVMVWLGTTNNEMSTLVFYVWLFSILAWAWVLSPLGFNPLTWMSQQTQRLTSLRLMQWASKHRWALLVFVVFFVLAASFRLTYLNGDASLGTAIPPEMTSDHVEKILDSNRVLEGSRNIFFANNGGREPIQMYLMALFSTLPGQGMNFESLKLLAVVESLLSLPIFFLFGREIIGRSDRRLGIIVGLLLVGLIAVSYWHVVITRLALRIILTPLVASLLMVYLARALRHNRRSDFIKAGLVLGFGLYTYQAVRMLPVVIVVAVAIAIYFSARNWRDRWRYTFNLTTLVFISFMIFLPLFHYSVENPEQFWRRTTGRLLGDDVIQETLDDGSIIEREASLGERLEAFNQNVPVMMSNIRNVLLMFNWKGDVGWINGYSNHPVLDPITGALFLLGLVAWGTWSVRHRDAVYWLIPIALFIMLLPSALSIAFPIENPSNTRTSGAMPMVYLIASLPLAWIVVRLLDILPQWRGRVATFVVCGIAIMGANAANTSIYFNDFRELYVASSLPYDDAGRVLQGFAISDGSYGNAFMIAYPFWWDHRALAIESGRPDWNNGIVSIADVPQFMFDAYQRDGAYRFDPERDVLFFFSKDDAEARLQLQSWFPDGREIVYPTYHANDEFSLYRVPVMGEAVFLDFIIRTIEPDEGVE